MSNEEIVSKTCLNGNDISTKLWSVLNQTRFRRPNSLLDFAKALKDVDPNASYQDFQEFMGMLIKGRYYSYDSSVLFPVGFDWFVKAFVDNALPDKVLIPYANGSECDLLSSAAAVEYHFPDKDCEQAVALFVDITTLDGIPQSGSYDLITSVLPVQPISANNSSYQLVEQCSKLLSHNGYCIFPFSKSITTGSSVKWLRHLEEMGLYCSAVIDLPAGAYMPHSSLDAEIVVFSKKKPEKRFVALLSSEEFAADIVKNYLSGNKSTRGAKLGIYVDGNFKSYADYYNYSRLQNKYKTLAKSYNGELHKINEIGEVFAQPSNDDLMLADRENAVYIPKLGRSPVVLTSADFQMKPQNYFQVVVNPKIVLPRFLAFFLNTEEGINVRQLSYSGATIKAFNMKTLGEMAIPCPTIKLQSEYLKTYDRLEALHYDIEALKNRMQKTPASYASIRQDMKDINNTGDKFVQWIETLPYPIATILKRYSVSEDANKKQEMLFFFYEAYSIFTAALLSAALNKNLVDCSALKEVDPAYFEKASFGNWVRMDRSISNLYLGMINSSDEDKKKAVLDCFKTTDENLIKFLCSKNDCNILDNACNYRNSWKGHTGITNDALYLEHVEILDGMLRKLQDSIKDLYERIRLLRPISLSFSNGIFSNKVEILTGSNPIFAVDTIDALLPLDSSKLYLQMVDTGETIEVPPYFILKNSPADAKNACYFYSRSEKGNTKYVSYHYDGKPEDTESGENAFDHIKELLAQNS